MRKVILNIKEFKKYEVIKRLVDSKDINSNSKKELLF